MSFVVVGYFTTDTLYEQEAARMIKSLRQHEIPYYIEPVENLGDWFKNTQFKPFFLRQMVDRFKPKSLVYIDVDAEFLAYPALFDELDARPDVHIGVHLLDHAKRGRPHARFEMLSGTIFLKNDDVVRDILDRWIGECTDAGALWDQVALAQVLKGLPYYVLPEEYCTIFDYMNDVVNPVIRHYQASRRAKESLGASAPLPTYTQPPIRQPASNRVPRPRKIARGGLVRHPRKWRDI
jgi:hypothetical protein